MSTGIVEPYNSILTTDSTLDSSQCVFLADNEALHGICNSKLDISSPNYGNLNRILAQTVVSITASIRFKGFLNTDFTDFQNNLVPFPRIHFPMMSYAPISSNSTYINPTVTDITRECFADSNRLMKCNMKNGKYISCCLLYRGDVAPKDVNDAITKIKERKNIQFVDWSPTGFKIGINALNSKDEQLKLKSTERSLCMVYNTTAIQEPWSKLIFKYKLLLSKKAFLHWYFEEGMCEQEFIEARENLVQLQSEYNHL